LIHAHPRPRWGAVARALVACLGAAVLFLLAGARPARADDLADIQAQKKLFWGADQEGGGPFTYPDPADPERIIGFEVEMAEAIARYLAAEPVFTQGPWDNLLAMAQADKVQIVLNGYEWTPERADQFEASIPYFVYALQLMTRKDDARITSWESFQAAPPDGGKWQVGVLGGSAAEDYMKELCATAPCEVAVYDGNTDAMRDVETERLDATLQDTPIVAFYGKEFPRLHNVDKPVAPGFYAIYAKKGETELIRKMNEALVVLIRSGELERIYRKYGIWDELNEQLDKFAEDARYFGYLQASITRVEAEAEAPTAATVAETTTKRSLGDLVSTYLPMLAQASLMTILLAVVSFPIAIAIGILVAVGRLYGPGWLRVPLTAYVEFLRGTPLMLQLYFIFFVLPEVGVNIPAVATAIFGLAINYSAYESEIYRSGLQAIPHGQMEAALSLGMSRAQAIRQVVLPQAFRIVIPPVVNDFIALFKDTSVCSVITIIELTKQFSILSKSTLAVLEMMGMTALLYLAMSYPLSIVSRRIERHLGTTGPIA
jgi:polar amino acid transport system substrate-binding protein